MKTLDVKKILFIGILIMLNFMKVIKIGDASFNMALSDGLLPFTLLVLMFETRRKKFRNVFFLWQWALILLGWLILTGVLGILNPEVVSGEIKGLLGELIKTAISLGYFYVGYNIMCYLKLNTLKKVWIFNVLSFILLGSLWMYLVKLSALNNILDMRYRSFFMGTYTDPNHAATFLGINALILFNWSIIETKMSSKILYGFIGLMSGAFILLTDSRGGLLAFGLGVFILCLFHYKSILKYGIEIITSLVGILVIVFTLENHMIKSGLISRLYSSFQNFESGLDVRKALANTALAMGLEHPFLGVGRGNYVLNSKPYFDALGLKYVENIPHNTYIGLFAETGIIGLLLFTVPILVLIYLFIRKWSYLREKIQVIRMLSFGIPIAAVIGVQGFVLNIENQRILWFVIGMALYYMKQFYEDTHYIEDVVKMEVLPSKSHLKRQLIALFILISLVSIGKNAVYINLNRQSVSEQFVKELPVNQNSDSLEYEVAYQIVVPLVGKNQHCVQMELVEIEPNGSEITLFKKMYTPVNGVEKLNFVKSEKDSRVKLTLKNINPNLNTFYVKPMYVQSQNRIYYMDRLYFLSINALNKTSKFKMIKPKVTVEKSNVKYFEQYKFDKYFVVDTVKEEINSDCIVLTLRLQLLEEIAHKTSFWFYGIPDNISVLNRSQMISGRKYLKPIQGDTFERLHKDQVVFLTFEIPKDADYVLRFGGFQLIEDKMSQFKDIKTNLMFLELGRTSVD